MIRLITFFFILISALSYSQNSDFHELLKKGKAEFDKKRRNKDFSKSVKLLDSAVQLKPGHAEAHYFLGYAYDNLNIRGKGEDEALSSDLTKQASHHFEKVIEISPKYNGEMLTLDPYTKLTSLWGQLAIEYLAAHGKDSAKWALKNGKQRGGFSEFNLAFQKLVLKHCTKNGILTTFGDMNFYPAFYQQLLNNKRKDVSLVEMNLLNAKWYPKYLQEKGEVDFGLSKSELDSTTYIQWETSTVSIGNLKWTIPSYGNQSLLRSHVLFLHLLQTNTFKRDVYFSPGFPEKHMLGLAQKTTQPLLVNKVAVDGNRKVEDEVFYNRAKQFLKLVKKVNPNSQIQMSNVHRIRSNVYKKADKYLNDGKTKEAEKLINLIDKHANAKDYPYHNDEYEKAANAIRDKLND